MKRYRAGSGGVEKPQTIFGGEQFYMTF